MNKKRFLTIFVIAFLFAISVGFAYLLSIQGSAEGKESYELITRQLHDSIEGKIKGAVSVASAMAGDPYVKELLENEKAGSGEGITEYLSGVMDSTEMDNLFLISNDTGRSYSRDGFYGRMSSADSWYRNFMDSNVPCAVFVVPDRELEHRWSAAAVVRLKDREGTTVGACGAAVEMSDLPELFRSYKKTYAVNARLVDSEGSLRVDENGSAMEAIEEISLGGSILSNDEEDYVYIKRKNDGYLVTEYVNLLDWYLLVEGIDHVMVRERENYLLIVVVESIIFTGAALSLLLGAAGGNRFRNRKNTLQTDELTGLFNRNYFKDVYGERGIFNTARYKAIAVFDIDFFKEANDTLDGDAVLKRVADLAREAIGERGEIFRWGGDEFMMLMEWSVSFSYELCREFCQKVEDDGRVTISVGVTEIRLSDTIKKNYYRAAQGCYLVKEMGGNGVKRC